MLKYLIAICVILFPILVSGQGSLLLVGGGSEYSSWADDPYGWFVQQADSGKIINIDVDQVSSYYPSYFKSLGAANSCEAFRIATRQAAIDSATYKKLISAKGIFIEGGDQSDYILTWKGTLVQDAIHYVFHHGGAIGGTSAGLAVLGEVVYDATGGYLYPDKAAYNPYHPDITLTDDFLNILPKVLTDSHFHPRGRLARLVPMLARRIVDNGQDDLMGVGVCENTAMCIDKDGNGKVWGDASVTIIYQSDDSVIDCQPGIPVTFTNIVFHHLTRGAVFNFNTRELVDPGPYLQPVTDYQINNNFNPVIINGIEDSSMAQGSIIIKGITSDDEAAWQGKLAQSAGENNIPNSLIINKLLWENARNETYYYENRWIGGMWGIADKPGYRAIYLNGDADNSAYNAIADISAQGMLSVTNGIVYIFDTNGMTYKCSNYTRAGNRSTNYRGMFNAQLHFLKTGDQFDLNIQPTKVKDEKIDQPIQFFDLLQNYPNPFNSSTTIRFNLMHEAEIDIRIFNLRGELIKQISSTVCSAGFHEVTWNGIDRNGNSVASGVYCCCLMAGNLRFARKMTILR
jgi:cyanophycinase